jgi:hypothetical protein
MTDIVEQLQACAERNSVLYGSGGVPPNDLLPADKMWFAALDAAKEIERLRVENADLRERLDAASALVRKLSWNVVNDHGSVYGYCTWDTIAAAMKAVGEPDLPQITWTAHGRIEREKPWN